MQYDRVQCNIAESFVYIVLKLQLSCVFISRREAVCMLDSDTKPWVWCMLFEHRLHIKYRRFRSDVVEISVTVTEHIIWNMHTLRDLSCFITKPISGLCFRVISSSRLTPAPLEKIESFQWFFFRNVSGSSISMGFSGRYILKHAPSNSPSLRKSRFVQWMACCHPTVNQWLNWLVDYFTPVSQKINWNKKATLCHHEICLLYQHLKLLNP